MHKKCSYISTLTLLLLCSSAPLVWGQDRKDDILEVEEIPAEVGAATMLQKNEQGFDHTLHAVMTVSSYVVKPKNVVFPVEVVADATASHTHDPDRKVVKYRWSVNQKAAGRSSSQQALQLTKRKNRVCLKIFDDAGKEEMACETVRVVAPGRIPDVYERWISYRQGFLPWPCKSESLRPDRRPEENLG